MLKTSGKEGIEALAIYGDCNFILLQDSEFGQRRSHHKGKKGNRETFQIVKIFKKTTILNTPKGRRLVTNNNEALPIIVTGNSKTLPYT